MLAALVGVDDFRSLPSPLDSLMQRGKAKGGLHGFDSRQERIRRGYQSIMTVSGFNKLTQFLGNKS
jgi:hypothetical protein